MVLFPFHPMGYHIPILQLVLLGMALSLFHPTTCHLRTLLVDTVLSLFQLWEWHTPILLLVIMLSPFQLTIIMSPSHTTCGYGAVAIPSQGAMVHSHSGRIIPAWVWDSHCPYWHYSTTPAINISQPESFLAHK